MIAWGDLKYVLALSQHGTATAAARSLGVNGTTVARRIAALEEHLGTRLFDKRGNETLPTPAGEIAIAVAARIEAEVHGLDAEIQGLDGELRGSLSVTAMDVMFETWRTDIAEFRRRYPRVTLSLASSNRPVDLTRREADVAIRFPASPPEHLVGRRLSELLFAVYVSEDLVTAVCHGRDPSTVPYAAYPWLGWEAPFAEPTDRVIDQYAPGADVHLRVTSMSLLVRSIEDGLGVSVLPCVQGDRNPSLVRLGHYFEGGTYLWALTHDQLRDTARVRAFMDFVGELAVRDKDMLLGRSPRRPTVPVAS